MNPTKICIIAIVLCFLLPVKGHSEISKTVVMGADDIKPEYNIVIWNLTDEPIKNIVVAYGDETFKISRMESFTFKMRNFVDYDVPATVIFQWQDIQGNNHKKEATMPSYKLDVDSLSSLFLRINEGNSFSIAWQGYGADEYFGAYSKIEFAVIVPEREDMSTIRGSGNAVIVEDKEMKKELSEFIPWFAGYSPTDGGCGGLSKGHQRRSEGTGTYP